MWDYTYYPTTDELYHHGILGMHWGKRNGPPYPLNASDHSSSEKKAGWRKSLDSDGKVEKAAKKANKAAKKANKAAKKANKAAKKVATEKKKSKNAEIKKAREDFKKEASKLVDTYSKYEDDMYDAIARGDKKAEKRATENVKKTEAAIYKLNNSSTAALANQKTTGEQAASKALLAYEGAMVVGGLILMTASIMHQDDNFINE